MLTVEAKIIRLSDLVLNICSLVALKAHQHLCRKKQREVLRNMMNLKTEIKLKIISDMKTKLKGMHSQWSQDQEILTGLVVII